MPHGGFEEAPHRPTPHSGRGTRVPPVLPGPRIMPRGGLRRHCTTHPHIAVDPLESLRPCMGRRGMGTPRAGSEETLHHPLPHSG